MKVAVVGTGVAGLCAARALAGRHELTVFEAGEHVGGHVHTVDVALDGRSLAVDTGFIVFNERTYPGFCALLRELGVPWQPSDMSFSVRCERGRLEYNGTSLDGLFAQRSNLLRPSFWRMLRDLLRFYREAPAALAGPDAERTLGQYLERGRYSRAFVEQHLVPMAAAIWSARPAAVRELPLGFLVRFFHNHGFLELRERPQWLVVQGGSRRYVERLVAPFRERVRLRTPVARVARGPGGVRLRTAAGEEALFDRVVLACHADQSLRLLADADAREREVLGSFAFQANDVVLHSDASLMPRRRRAWASWNYRVEDPPSELPTVTYWMNNLQGLAGAPPLFVTLNRSGEVDPARVLRRFVYSHPVYSHDALRAQARHAEIDGRGGVHFCGAYWGYGFHEDGLQSGLVAARRVERRAAA